MPSGAKQCPRCQRWLAEYEQICPCGFNMGSVQAGSAKRCSKCKRWLSEYEQVCPCHSAGSSSGGGGGGGGGKKTKPVDPNGPNSESDLEKYRLSS